MSTFDELIQGTSEAEKRTMDFFVSIRNTFTPIPIMKIEPEPAAESADNMNDDTTTNASVSSSLRKRSASSSDGQMPSNKKQKRLNLIVVVHLLPTLPAYLRALQIVGDIKVIIFKGPEENKRPEHMEKMAKWVRNTYSSAVVSITKDDLKNKDKVIEVMTHAIDTLNGEILIMDIGGYFAPCLLDLADPNNHEGKWKLIGIVEDTENGHQKYHKSLERFATSNLVPPNIFSVARSQMKATEDYNVGKSLVRAADTILRQSLDLRLEDHPVIGVIGFGKIGSSIAMHLRQQHIGTVMVYDVNPAIMLRALSQDFVVCAKDEMLQKASFIFCATGNKALSYNDLLNVGSAVRRLVIASCTSADDELDVHGGLEKHKNKSFDSRDFSSYSIQRLNGEFLQVILLCNGNAVNFYCQAILGESIRSVQAAMIVCALKLEQITLIKNESKRDIQTLTEADEMTIARIWLQHFPKLDVRLITNVNCALTRFDVSNITEMVGDLPVNEKSIIDLKRYLGLERSENIDPIDFMNSERKLIITAPRGFGKTAVLFDLIRKIRNFYDLIWWFDCSDSLDSMLCSLAQEFRVSTVELSFTQLQKEVLKAVLSSMAINNFLLIVDNVQDYGKEESVVITAKSVHADNTQENIQQLNCHTFLADIYSALKDPTMREQRRRHVVALYTEDIVNSSRESEHNPIQNGSDIKDWTYVTLTEDVEQAKTWMSKQLSSLSETVKITRQQLIENILSVDMRRLTIRLSALILTSYTILPDELNQIQEVFNLATSSQSPDILSCLVKLILKRLEDRNKRFFQCIQMASLVRYGSISREIFHHMYNILIECGTTESNHHLPSEIEWQNTWNELSDKLKQYCILKQNFLAPIIHTHLSQHYIPPEYVEVYSIPSTFVKQLRKSLLNDRKSLIWKYALLLVEKGFNYDYHDSKDQKSLKYEQNISHYLDHATALISHTDNWTGEEEYAELLGRFLCRMGSYYLNERRMYSEAASYYSRAHDIFENMLHLDKHSNENNLPLFKWIATVMWKICEQLSDKRNQSNDEQYITELNEASEQLSALYKILPETQKSLSKRYQIEATIAIARIQVVNARKSTRSEKERTELLECIKSNLEEFNTLQDISIRTRSLLLQILGCTYSLLKDHHEAAKYLRLSITEREKVLPSEHLDTARTKYRLACSLVAQFEDIDSTEEKHELVGEAQQLCETAFKIQRTQLPADHTNLQECKDLRTKIDDLLKWMQSKPSEIIVNN